MDSLLPKSEVDSPKSHRGSKKSAPTQSRTVATTTADGVFGDRYEEIQDHVADVISKLDVPQIAKLEGARLAEAWIAETTAFDKQFTVVAVEIPFFFLADKYTIVVGVQDRIACEGELKVENLFGNEWKTTKGTTKFWNEEKWLDKMRASHQPRIYACAQKYGYFLFDRCQHLIIHERRLGSVVASSLGNELLWKPGVPNPRIMVRAITKENPPAIWPSEGQVFLEFTRPQLKATMNALKIKGEQIRAARLLEERPWQLPGLQCENRFSHTMCQFYDDCRAGKTKDVLTGLLRPSGSDPGLAALPMAAGMISLPIDDPRVVVLSASSYEDVTGCMEYFRLVGSGHVPEHYYQEELNVGTAFHAAVAEYGRALCK